MKYWFIALLVSYDSFINCNIEVIDNGLATEKTSIGVPNESPNRESDNHQHNGFHENLYYMKDDNYANSGNDIHEREIGRSYDETSINLPRSDALKNVPKEIRADNKLINNILQQHQGSQYLYYNNKETPEKDKDIQTDKKKGTIKAIVGTIGVAIGAFVTETVRIFGDLVGDIAREITAHGFVEMMKKVSDIMGLSEQNNINLIQ